MGRDQGCPQISFNAQDPTTRTINPKRPQCQGRATCIRPSVGCGCDGLSCPAGGPSRAASLRALQGPRAAVFPTPARLTELFLLLISAEAAQCWGLRTAEMYSPHDQTLRENSLKEGKSAQGENIKSQLGWFWIQPDKARQGGRPGPWFSKFREKSIVEGQERPHVKP